MSNESDELKRLCAENARLIALLESHDIDWQNDPAPTTVSGSAPPEISGLSTAEKSGCFGACSEDAPMCIPCAGKA